MRYPLLVIFEADGRITASLQALANEWGCQLRHLQQAEACLRTLPRGDPAVLILRCGRDLEREFSLLDQVTTCSPTTRSVVLLDRDDSRLTTLAWDLGACYVLSPIRWRDYFVPLLQSLLQRPN